MSEAFTRIAGTRPVRKAVNAVLHARNPGPRGLDAFEMWPEDRLWSFQLLRMLGQSSLGGAEFAEVHRAASRIRPGDAGGWYDSFTELASANEASARAAADQGHPITARQLFIKASNYHRAAGSFHDPASAPHISSIDARRRCFVEGTRQLDDLVDPIEIPYEGSTLPGYWMRPTGGGPRPTAIAFGGTDAVAEEMYLAIGRPLLDRGFAVLAVDGPGQGEALRRGILMRHDWEVPVGACIDAIADDPACDPTRIVVVGQSLGGYLAARAAAREPRLAAAVVWGAMFEIDPDSAATRTLEELLHFWQIYQRMFAISTRQEFADAVDPFDLTGVAHEISIPLLILHGESDRLIGIDHAIRLRDAVASTDVHLEIFRAGEPGCTHCQIDAPWLAQNVICDWLETRFPVTGP